MILLLLVCAAGHQYKGHLVRSPALLLVSMGDEEAKVRFRVTKHEIQPCLRCIKTILSEILS